MSSHHFVKEGQEPALFVLDAIPFHMVEPLLEWVPLVVVADKTIDVVLTWGIKIDAVLQQRYSITYLEDYLKDQHPVAFIPGDENPVINGLTHLWNAGYSAANVVSVRANELLPLIDDAALPIQVGIYGESEKWSLITAGSFEKWMPAGTLFKIRGAQELELHTKGVIQNGEYYQSERAEMIQIEAKKPFWVGENSW